MFRKVAKIVFRERGQFRTVENLGVRPISYPYRLQGKRYDDARWVTALYDVNPEALRVVSRALRDDPDVMNLYHVRADDKLAQFKPDSSKSKPRFSTAVEANDPIFNPEGAGKEAAARD
jgi:ribosomal protein S6